MHNDRRQRYLHSSKQLRVLRTFSSYPRRVPTQQQPDWNLFRSGLTKPRPPTDQAIRGVKAFMTLNKPLHRYQAPQRYL
jgi:hypothetical protein